jgi:hypothetical protein
MIKTNNTYTVRDVLTGCAVCVAGLKTYAPDA